MYSRLLFIISSHTIGLRLLARILEWANPSEAKRLYMAIELTKEARQNAINSIQKYFEANLEERIGFDGAQAQKSKAAKRGSGSRTVTTGLSQQMSFDWS
jgi:hypothetical protein